MSRESESDTVAGESQQRAPPDDEPKSSADILSQQIRAGLNELNRPSDGLFLSGLSAGLDIGFGPLLMAVMITISAGQLPDPVIEVLMANLYAVGFVFVVMGRSELFTEHTTLAVLPVLDRQASITALGRLWGIIYVANLIGGTAFAAFAVYVGPALGVIDVTAFGELGRALTEHPIGPLTAGAVLAGWLMGLLSWLVAAARDTISRLFFVWIIAASIGLAHLPHSIAGTVEVLMALFSGAGVTPLDYLRFLLAATVGNAIGGAIFVALLKYGHVVRGGDIGGEEVSPDRARTGSEW